jgi:hypothetical protein
MGHAGQRDVRAILDNERFQPACRMIRASPIPGTGCNTVTNVAPGTAGLNHTPTLD